ncbi:MAG TPA: hypothetical protein VFE47_29335 [Tepidisphaeraceae bacterium]|jgi:hypothetical protein|nr:hypothetical protein [Tepidisphaeraceae bacterium]
MKASNPILALLVLLIFTSGVHAAQMFRFDLQSLAYMSTAVIEGDVTDAQTVHWVDKLTIKITKVYAGDYKTGDTAVVGLSAYAKVGKDAQATEKFGTGDHLVLFIEPVTQQSWRDDAVPYWPVASGLKLIVDGKVTGVEQTSNPGAYENTVDEGNAADYPQKVADAVKWAAEFHKAIKEKKNDSKWLLEQLLTAA